jgi:hypothetical protein
MQQSGGRHGDARWPARLSHIARRSAQATTRSSNSPGAAVAYVRFAAEAGAGFDVIFSGEIDTSEHPDLARTGALSPACCSRRRSPSPFVRTGDRRSERAHIALVHGYAALLRAGFFNTRADEVAERAATAVRTLVAGYVTSTAS